MQLKIIIKIKFYVSRFFFIVFVFVYHCINCSVHYAVFFSIKCWQENHLNSLWKVWSTQFFVLFFFSYFTCSEFWYKWVLATNGKSFEQGTKTILFINVIFLQVFTNRMVYINGCSLFKRNTISILEYSEQYLVMTQWTKFSGKLG